MKVVFVECQKLNPIVQDFIQREFQPDCALSTGLIQTFELTKEDYKSAAKAAQTSEFIECLIKLKSSIDVDSVITSDPTEIIKLFHALRFVLSNVKTRDCTIVIYGKLANECLYDLVTLDDSGNWNEDITVSYSFVEKSLNELIMPSASLV